MSNLITEGLGSAEAGALALQAVALDSATVLRVVFTEDVSLGAVAATAAGWRITHDEGAVDVSVLEVEVLGDVVLLTTTEHTQDGAYALIFPIDIVTAESGSPFTGPFQQAYEGIGNLPTITMVKAIDARTVDVVFSKAVLEEDATVPSNYTIDGASAVSVISVEKVTDQTYRLTTTEQDRSAAYSLTVANIRDVANNPVSHT